MEFLEAFDQGFWNFLQAQRSPWLDCIVRGVNTLGTIPVLFGIILAAAAFLLLRRRFASAGLLVAAFAGALALGTVLGLLVHRERPEPSIRPLETADATSSFPSRPTLRATTVYLTLALVFGADLRPRFRQLLMVGASGLVLLIGAARMFIGICYPTDVMAGWLAGLAWALTCGWLHEKLVHAETPIQ